jgi:hypothetical protein
MKILFFQVIYLKKINYRLMFGFASYTFFIYNPQLRFLAYLPDMLQL